MLKTLNKMKHMLSPRSVMQSFVNASRAGACRNRAPLSFELSQLLTIAHFAHLRTWLLCALCASGLAACGGERAVVSEDKSVDYRSARSLPPLMKTLPSNETNVPTGSVSTAPTSSMARDKAVPDTARSYAPTSITSEPLQNDSPDSMQIEVGAQTSPEQAGEPPVNVSSSIITTADNTSRLLVTASLNTAWNYVIAQARGSKLSIFSRNVADARMYIGCKGIPQEGSAKKKKGWTIFNRDKPAEAAQYCSLKLQEQGSNTHVLVLDTTGTEVDAEFAEPILNGLMQ